MTDKNRRGSHINVPARQQTKLQEKVFLDQLTPRYDRRSMPTKIFVPASVAREIGSNRDALDWWRRTITKGKLLEPPMDLDQVLKVMTDVCLAITGGPAAQSAADRLKHSNWAYFNPEIFEAVIYHKGYVNDGRRPNPCEDLPYEMVAEIEAASSAYRRSQQWDVNHLHNARF